MSTVITLIQAEEVVNQGIVKGSPLSSRFDASQISPNIEEAERRFFKTFINDEFYNDLVAQKNPTPSNYNNDLGPIVLAYPNNALYETLWTQKFFSYLSRACYHESLDNIVVQIGSNGAFVNDTEYGQNVGISGLKFLKDSALQTLEGMQPSIIKYLCDNKANYPLWNSEEYCGECSDNKRQNRRFCFQIKNKSKKMSTKNLAKTITVLEDGKLSVFLNSGQEVYIQPPLVVDTLDNIDELIIRGEDKNNAKVDTTVSELDGVPFAGTFEDLETALRELAKKGNGLFSGASGGGGGLPPDAATETKQDVQIDQLDEVLSNQDEQTVFQEKITEQLAVRGVNTYIDLSLSASTPWAGFPVTINEFQWNDGTFFPANTYPITPTEVNDTTELADLWNANVPDNLLEARDSNTLYIKEGSAPIPTDNNGLIQFSTSVPAFGVFPYIKVAAWSEEPDAVESSVNKIENKVTQLADGGESLVSTENGIATYNNPTNIAITLVPAAVKRENVFIQCHSGSLWIRLKPAATTPNEREGIYLKAIDGVPAHANIPTLSNGQKYTGEISLINAVDGEEPTYSISILNRP